MSPQITTVVIVLGGFFVLLSVFVHHGTANSEMNCAENAPSSFGLLKGAREIRNRRSYETRRNKDHPSGNALKASSSGGAVFVTENSTVIVAQIGGTAKLPCVVRKFNNGVVSWIRKQDSPPTILTVGLTTYNTDERFMVEHARHLQNWGLVIKHVRPFDAGLYECQVSTHPTTSIFIELRVTEASAEIIGAPDLHIRAGSTLRLVCTLRHSTERPQYVFWYHEQRMINHDQGVMVTADRASSVLQLEDADTSHNGNYTCYPSNAIPAYINVHVLNSTEGNVLRSIDIPTENSIKVTITYKRR